MRATILATEGFFRGLSGLGRFFPGVGPALRDVEVVENIRYSPDDPSAHRLDVYRPRRRPPRHPSGTGRSSERSSSGAGRLGGRRGSRRVVSSAGGDRRAGDSRLPVVMYVHGGGFSTLSKDTHWMMGLMFARAGYLVCNISYRLAPRHPYPAAIADTCAAYAWITRNIAYYGGDPETIVVAGESAGANLVTALTLATCYERPESWARRAYDTGVVPAATLPFCGLLEVSNPARFARRRPVPPWVDRMIHHCCAAYIGRKSAVPPARAARGGRESGDTLFEVLDLANPLTTLERARVRDHRPQRALPPFFVSVGTRDPLLDDSRRLAQVLRDLGVACDARYYPGEVHAFQAMTWRGKSRESWRDAFGFLARHLGGR